MILAYHRVNPWYPDDALTVTPENFERQIGYLLKKGYVPVSLSEYLPSHVSRLTSHTSRFVVSFDDGFADNLLFAWPVLRKLEVKPVIFLSVNFIGTEKLLPRYRDREKDRFLRWKEVQDMARGEVEFGSHGLTHPRLTSLDRKTAWDEIFRSKKELERNLGKKVEYFCYPYGAFNDTIAEAVKNAGYSAAVVTARATKRPDPYRIPRVGVYGHNSFPAYRVKLWKAAFERTFS